MKPHVPRLSVVMSVFNGEKYLCEAVNSVLNQTFSDFELIIIDDGSVDNTFNLISSFHDRRIRCLRNTQNLGLISSLNIGLSLVSSKYIARMDADDIALPRRFEEQISFLEENPQVGLLGSAYDVIDDLGVVVGHSELPLRDLTIRWNLLFNNSFCHSTLLMRKLALDAVGGLYRNYILAEDYHLVSQITKVCKVANLSNVLVRWRRSDKQISVTGRSELEKTAARISRENINYLMGYHFISESEAMKLYHLLTVNELATKTDIKLLYKIIQLYGEFECQNSSFDMYGELHQIKKNLTRKICDLASVGYPSTFILKLFWECLKLSPIEVAKCFIRPHFRR